MSLDHWEPEGDEVLADMGIFTLHRLRSRSPRTGSLRTLARIESSDWVNVVALNARREVVLVRQFRHGTRTFTLEIPGGLVDEGESPGQAAVRELREETGWAGTKVRLIGVVSPNPAIQDNRCHTYLVEECGRVDEPRLEEGEDLEVEVRPLADIPGLIADGTIHHSLVVCAFWWLAQALPESFAP